MVLVAVQRNMMRWGRKDKVYPSLSSFACVPVIKASIPIVAPRSPMLNSPCTLSFYCLSTEHYAWLWLPLCECPTDTKQHISGATKEHVAGLGLRILFKHWISWNELWVFTCVYYCFYSCGLHIWHSTPENLCIYPPLFQATAKFQIFCSWLHCHVYPAAPYCTPAAPPVGVVWACRTVNNIQDKRMTFNPRLGVLLVFKMKKTQKAKLNRMLNVWNLPTVSFLDPDR